MGICFRNPEAFIKKRKIEANCYHYSVSLHSFKKKEKKIGISLMAQCLIIHASNAECLVPIHDQEIDIPHATCCSQKIKKKKK